MAVEKRAFWDRKRLALSLAFEAEVGKWSSFGQIKSLALALVEMSKLRILAQCHLPLP